jgi:hypothetical protein
MSVAVPTARNTKIAVPRNSTTSFRIIACPLAATDCHNRAI